MAAERRLISSGSAFEAQIGYSRAVVSGDFVFVSGCTGYDYKAGAISDDVAEQAEQAMKNVAAALVEAGMTVDDIVRVRYIVTNRLLCARVFPVLRRWLGSVRPAATMVVAGLVEEAMLIEVEVTAHRPSSRGG